MANNRTFFKKAQTGKMSYKDIFSEVFRKHSPEETAHVFIAGTPLTTPDPRDMLAGWQKPFLFARFFAGYVLMLLMAYVMNEYFGHMGGYSIIIGMLPFLMPVTLLLLVWEMNVPRNISLYEILLIVGIGGVASLIAAIIGFNIAPDMDAMWAGIVEEPAKLIIVYIVLTRKNYKHTLNGILIGVAVGTGFAAMESLFYAFKVMRNYFMNIFYVGYEQGWSMADLYNDSYGLWALIMERGVKNALTRSMTAISGHGIFAALYGGMLVKVKGAAKVSPAHLLNPKFLAYFVASVALHALHNSGIDLGLPVLFDMLPVEYILIAIVALILLLHMLRLGVNETVEETAKLNGGRVTIAVNREAAAPAHMAGEASIHAENAGGYQPAPTAPVGRASSGNLRCIAGPYEGSAIALWEGKKVTMGRVPGRCDVVLEQCSSVSGTHCAVSMSGGNVVLTDLGSTNGTYLNGHRIAAQQSVQVPNGSVIHLGGNKCAFRLELR